MPKVKVDKDICIGCGLCSQSCEDCFEIGSDGKSNYKHPEITSCDLDEIVANCPVGAITLSKDE